MDSETPKTTQVYGIHGTFVGYKDDLITKQIVEFGAHTRNEISMLLHHVQSGAVCVDLGAHIGTFAIALAKAAGENGRVLAAEANPDTYSLLQKNVALNHLNERITTELALIGDGQARALTRFEISGNSGAGYYSPDTIAEALPTVDPSALLRSHGFDMPSIIKMDIEGMEGIALRSLADIITAAKPILYLEIASDQLKRHGDSPQSIEALLRSWDYRFFRNTGARNSDNDIFIMTELESLTSKDRLFDLLAIPIERLEALRQHSSSEATATLTPSEGA